MKYIKLINVSGNDVLINLSTVTRIEFRDDKKDFLVYVPERQGADLWFEAPPGIEYNTLKEEIISRTCGIQSILTDDIRDCGLSPRLTRILRENGLTTVGTILSFSIEEYATMRGMGANCLIELISFINDKNIILPQGEKHTFSDQATRRVVNSYNEKLRTDKLK